MCGHMNIKIGAFDYILTEVEEPILLDHVECSGIIDYNNLTINIKKDYNIQLKKRTILHEVFHGIINEYGIDISDIDEEILVENLGTAIYQVIKDNKELIDYIRHEV